MDWVQLAYATFMAVYTFALAMVCLYGFHRFAIVFLFAVHRSKHPKQASTFDELPRVTVQLPMYNEEAVARRIIEKTCEIDYPLDKLQIQVLDDSTDGTCEIAKATVADMQAKGFDVEYLHRDNRSGYKAGALSEGLKSATGEFVSIFDADFVPVSDFLLRSIQYFTDPKVCVVQSRWEHLNRNDSWLTKSQAIFLDGHFAIEHVARNRSDRFMSFNGTAGTWRRAAIDHAGGWQHDTLTEDLDLSYRAQLKGWKFVYLPELASPAELPPEMNAFKAQQFRWTKGGAQTALKLLPKLMLSKAPLKVKIEGFFHLTCFSMHIYMTVLLLLLFPAMYLQTTPISGSSMWRAVFDLSVFTLATMSATVFYAASQFYLARDWRSALKFMPMLMALGVGLCVSNTKAIIEALIGKESEFVRTPKFGTATAKPVVVDKNQPKSKRKIVPYLEFAFGTYMSICAILSIVHLRSAITAPFLIIFAFGFYYVSLQSFQAERAAKGVKKSQSELACERASD